MTLYTSIRPRNESLTMLDYEASTGEYVGAMFEQSWAGNPTQLGIDWLQRREIEQRGQVSGYQEPTAAVPEGLLGMPGSYEVTRQDRSSPLPDLSQKINAEAATKKAKEMGLDFRFEQDVSQGEFDFRVERKQAELARQQIFARTPGSITAGTLGIAATLAASALDPINVASAFIPVAREARLAALLAQMGKTPARLVRGALEGVAGAAAVEPLVYGLHHSLGDDYSLGDSFTNVVIGGVLGAGLHWGGGRIADAMSSEAALKRYLTKVVGDAIPDDPIVPVGGKPAPERIDPNSNQARHEAMDSDTRNSVAGFAVEAVKKGNLPAADAFGPIANQYSGQMIDAVRMPTTKSAVEGDDLYQKANAIVVGEQNASTSFIQRRLQIGFNEAKAIMDRLEQEGIISAADSAGKRKVIASPETQTVRIRAEPERFLDLEKPIQEQSDFVKKAYKEISGLDPARPIHKSGEAWFNNLMRTRPEALQDFHGAGIHGTKRGESHTVFDNALDEINQRSNQPLPGRAMVEDAVKRTEEKRLIDGTQEAKSGDDTIKEQADVPDVDDIEGMTRDAVDLTKGFLDQIGKNADHPMRETMEAEVKELQKVLADTDKFVSDTKTMAEARELYAKCMGRG